MMISDSMRSVFAPQTRVMLIIGAAMFMGACFFGVLVCAMADWAELKNFQAMDIFQWVGIALGIGAFSASFIVPQIVCSSAIKELDSPLTSPAQSKISSQQIGSMDEDDSLIQKLLGIFQTTSIIRLALIEGAVFFNFVMFMTDTHPVNLGIGVFGLLLLLIAIPFPSRVWSWVESTIENMRFQAGSR